MNSKLAIISNGKEITLKDDASISVELNNPIFNSVEMFSYPMEIPLDGNRHILKNVDDRNSDVRPIDYEHEPMRIIADGIPFSSGVAIVQEDERIEDSISLNIDASTQSFDKLIGDLQCRDIIIPASDRADLLIGQKIGNVKVDISYRYRAKVTFSGKKADKEYSSIYNDSISNIIEPQALGFSYPAICQTDGSQFATLDKQLVYKDGEKLTKPKVATSLINVTDEYGASSRYTDAPPAKFCNARVCYKHYDKDSNGETSSNVVEKVTDESVYEDHGPIWVLDADRPQSGVCFYVLYFLDCLFAHLGVQFDKSALLAVEDFKHLCFFTTKCAYDTYPAHGSWYTENDAEVIAGTKKAGDIKSYYYNNLEDINRWLSSRGCGGQFELESPEPKQVQSFKLDGQQWVVGHDSVQSIEILVGIVSQTYSANILNMYANSDNFPDESVSTIISSLENAFGIKFNYDYEQKKVTAYLIRDVFRKQDATPRNFHANVLSMLPMTEKITGVRQKYSEESDSKEQRDNVKRGVRDYNTEYNYIEYPKDRTIIGDNLYKSIFHAPSNGDMNVYIDRTTGNAYRVKIDSEATSANTMNARLFEVGQWKGVEYGDCSEINEDYISEFSIDFIPISFIDTNYRKELKCANPIGDVYDSEGNKHTLSVDAVQPMLVALVDEDMEHEFVEQRLRNTVSSPWADFYFTQIMNLVESYDPSGTDDGNSPLQSYDWGLSIAMMRGGGTDMTTQTYDRGYDGFDNSKWSTISGEYSLASDTMDQFGNQFDYNGTDEGIGTGERFSLKIRAYKQPEWADQPLCNADVAYRGLFDTFMKDYAYFILNRKKYHVTCLASVAQIADIPNHWKEWWMIDGKKCLINKVNTDISVKDGMGEVELEIYAM